MNGYVPMVLILVILIVAGVSFVLRKRAQTLENESITGGVTVPVERSRIYEEEHKREVIIGPSVDEPVVKISAWVGNIIPSEARRLEPNESAISRLNPMLQAVPSLLVAGELAQGSYMEVVVNGPLALTSDGTAYRGFVLGEKGITEHAKLLDPSRLSNLANAAMLWQVASVIVGQKHLADISLKLDEIKRGIERITNYLEDGRKSKMLGALDYYSQVAFALMHGELAQSVRQKFEDYEGEMLAIERHLMEELKRETKSIPDIKDPRSIGFGSDGLRNAIHARQTRLEELFEQWRLCLRTRVVGWRLLSAFPDEPYLKEARRIGLQESINAMISLEGLANEVDRRMVEKISSLKSMFEKEDTLEQKRYELSQRLWNEIDLLRSSSHEQRNLLESSKAMLIEQQLPIRLAIKLEEGQVVEAYQLPLGT